MVPRSRRGQPPDRRSGLPGRGLPPLGRSRRHAIGYVRDAKAVAPDKPWFMYLCPGASHAPHHVFKEWADRYQGRFDQGYEAIRAEILAKQKELGLLPQDVELSPINPHGEPEGITGPDGQPWPMLDFVRPWDSLTEDEQRCSSAWPRSTPASSPTPTTRSAVSSTTWRSRASSRTRSSSWSRTTEPAARAARTGRSTRTSSSTAIPDSIEENLARLDELGSPSSYNHYNTGWAWAFDTPFPYWKRFAGYEGGTADLCVVVLAQGDRGARRGAQPVRPRGRRRPDALRAPGHRAARGAQGLHAEPDRGRELRAVADRPGGAGEADAVLLDARDAGHLPRRAGSRTPCTRRSRAGGTSTETNGSSTTCARTAPRPATSPPSTRSCSRSSRACGSTTRASTRACPSTTGPPWRSS